MIGAPIRRQDPPSGEGTINDRSRPGRSAFGFAPLDVPEASIPEEARRRADPGLPEVSEIDLVRHYTRLSQMNYGVDTGFYPLGSCTMKYNPKVAETVAALPGFQRHAPVAAGSDGPGCARDAVAARGGALRDHRDGTRHAATARRRVRRDDRPADDARVSRGARRRADEGHHPGLGARDEPCERAPRRVPGGAGALGRARSGRRERAREARRRRGGRTHADQPEHARSVRTGDPGDREDRPRRRGARVLRRREPQRDPRPMPPRRHGLRHRAHQHAQDVRDAARRGRARRGSRRRGGGVGALPAGTDRPARRRDGHVPVGRRPSALDRSSPRLSRQRRASWSAHTPTCSCTAPTG